jgi:hypothetical protein
MGIPEERALTKRVCHSCRFFQAAGQDSMGWCTHPKRRLSSEVRIYVRANELPCRNDWAVDLWQLAEPAQADVVLDAIASPVPPATFNELGTLAALAQRPSSDALENISTVQGEDVVLGETTSLTSKDLDAAHEETKRLRRAHEEMRARNREHRSGLIVQTDDVQSLPPSESALWLAGDLRGRSNRPASVDRITERQDRSEVGDVSPVALGEMGRPFPKMTTFPEDDARFSSIPAPVEGIDLPFATHREAIERVVHRAGFEGHDDLEIAPWSNERAESAKTSAPSFEPDPAFFGTVSLGEAKSFQDSIRATQATVTGLNVRESEPEPVSSTYAAPVGDAESIPGAVDFLGDESREYAFRGSELTSSRLRRGRRSPERPARSGRAVYDREGLSWPEREPNPSGDPVVPFAEVDGVADFESDGSQAVVDDRPLRPQRDMRRTRTIECEGEPSREEQPADIWHGLDNDGQFTGEFGEQDSQFVEELDVVADRVDVGSAEWSSVPRMCATCRDFRPAENGERGWCTNKWAFSHRRMVDADELPCETSIGGWWLPHDDHWMSTIDVSAHSQPTPLLDQWLAHRSATNGDADHASPMRRRQRS